ncbi:MAG: glycosyltransferase family 39 protein, partial [Chloroflexi bacterium]|nr:glycosyltransferase family 39 protein [Chloroflexota bacterium]
AISPFLVYYSQEARPYIHPTCFALLAFYVFLRALAPGSRWRTWALYGLATLAAVNLHYYAAMATAAQGLYLLLRGRARSPQLKRWIVTMLVVAALYVPLLPTMLRQLGSYGVYWEGEIGLDVILTRSVMALGAGLTAPPSWAALSGALLVLLAAVALVQGLWTARRDRRAADGVLLLALYVALPILAVYVACLVKPKFHERFVIVAAPALYLLAARGLDVTFARVRIGARYRLARLTHQATYAVAVAVLVLAAVGPLYNLYTDPAYARDDYRALAAAIESQQAPTDAILLCAPYMYPAFTTYYHGGLPWDGLPKQTPADREATAAALNALTAGRDRLWLALWQDQVADPEGYVLDQLGTRCAQLAPPVEFPGLRLMLFDLTNRPTFTAEPGIQTRRPALFDGRIDLLGLDLDRTSTKCGETINLALFWQAREPLGEDLTAFVHLVNAADVTYAQQDKRPINDYMPTSKWQPGQVMKDEYHLFVPYGTPPGDYYLVVGLYRAATGQRLSVFGKENRVLPGYRYRVDHMYVMRMDAGRPADLRIPTPQTADLGRGLRFLGYECQPDAPAGAPLLVTLFWQAQGQIAGDAVVVLDLLDETGSVAATQQGRPANDTYPTPDWLPDTVVRDIRLLSIPPGVSPGRYRLRVTVRDADGVNWGQVDLATPITVRGTM